MLVATPKSSISYCIFVQGIFFKGFCGFAEICKVATLDSRKNKRPRVVSDNKKEEVFEMEEDGLLTMWNLPFDVLQCLMHSAGRFWMLPCFFVSEGKYIMMLSFLNTPVASLIKDTSVWS